MGAAVAVGAGMSIVGGVASAEQQHEAEVAEATRIRNMKEAAKMKYSGVEESGNMMKMAGRDYTKSMIAEVSRVSNANLTDTKNSIQEARSTSIANTEGITAGISKAKEQMSLEIQANKAVNTVKEHKTALISQLIEENDKRTNDINNKIVAEKNNMDATMAYKAITASTTSKLLNVVNGGMQGFQSGYSLGTAFL